MMKSVLKIGALGLLAFAIASTPAQLLAQSTNKTTAFKKSAVEKKAPSEKKRTGGGVHGNLAGMDKTAKTITVGKHTYQITSETKIFKAGKSAALEDGVLGEYVSLGYKTAEDGQLHATKVTFGKPEGKSAEKKKEK